MLSRKDLEVAVRVVSSNIDNLGSITNGLKILTDSRLETLWKCIREDDTDGALRTIDILVLSLENHPCMKEAVQSLRNWAAKQDLFSGPVEIPPRPEREEGEDRDETG